MIFGKIDYLNLLPLHVFLKKYPLANAFKQAMRYKKGVPSKLNQDLLFARIDAAVISSIESSRKKYKKLDMGICANKRVLSVLVEKNTGFEKDKASATSNALAQILQAKGKVIIGDRALKAYIKDSNAYEDLCALWYEKRQLPFVFARFSCVKKQKHFAKIVKKFLKTRVKIPQYILQDYAKTRQIKAKDIRNYLKFIYYEIGYKEKLALKMFLKETSKIKALNKG